MKLSKVPCGCLVWHPLAVVMVVALNHGWVKVFDAIHKMTDEWNDRPRFKEFRAEPGLYRRKPVGGLK